GISGIGRWPGDGPAHHSAARWTHLGRGGTEQRRVVLFHLRQFKVLRDLKESTVERRSRDLEPIKAPRTVGSRGIFEVRKAIASDRIGPDVQPGSRITHL